MAKTSKTNPISSSPYCSVTSLCSQRLASRKCGTEHAKAKSTRAKSTRATSRPVKTAAIDLGTSGANDHSAAVNGHGRDMPSLLRVADDLLGRSEPQYPTRQNRTAARTPPTVVHHGSPSHPGIASGKGNLSPIIGSPPFKQQVSSTYANDLNYSDDDDDFLLCDDNINDDAHDIDYMDTKKTLHGNRRGNLILGGPPQQDTSTITDSEKRQYHKARKEYTDCLRFERMRREPSDTTLLLRDAYTGDSTPTLRPESKVLSDRLEVGHSFASKSTLIMRVAEEANLRGIEFNTVRSDILTFKCIGTRFGVETFHSELNGWRMKVCATRDGDNFNGVDVCREDEVEAHPPKSPFRTVWVKDLIMDIISECPSATNQTLRQFLSLYGKPYAITDSIIQAARTQARSDIFGDPTENCKYAVHVKDALESEGHIVHLRFTTRKETIQNIERIVLSDENLRLKVFDGSTLEPHERRQFVEKWKEEIPRASCCSVGFKE
jgi:hypothetical protein